MVDQHVTNSFSNKAFICLAFWPKFYKTFCDVTYAFGTVFTTLHFLLKLRMGPIS